MTDPVIAIDRLPKRTLKALLNDPAKTAEAVRLVYVNDAETKGITRKRKGKTFLYFLGNKAVKDAAVLQRIKSLVIPPAWENIWICALEKGHRFLNMGFKSIERL